MAAEQLLGVLSLLGFNQAEAVGPALKAACENDRAKDIVLWLAENLTPEHVASSEDHQLDEEEQAVAEAFCASFQPPCSHEASYPGEAFAQREATAALLDSAAEELEAEVQTARELDCRERDRLGGRISVLRAKTEQQVSDLTGSLSRLEALVSQITSILSQGCNREELICFNQIHEYKDLDAKLMQALRSFYTAQFGSSLGDEGSGADTLAMAEAERLLFGDSETKVATRAMEVERMRLAYGASLEGNARMLAQQAKRERCLQALQGSLTRPELSSQDPDMLQAEAVKQQASLDRVLAHKQQILEKELPELCRSIASMHCWDVVKADYDTELQRNKYYSQRKELVLETLLARAARITALVTVAKKEAAGLLGVQDSLSIVREDIEELNAATRLRLAKHEAAKTLPVEKPEPLRYSPTKAPRPGDIEQQQRLFSERLAEVLENSLPVMQVASGNKHALGFKSAIIKDPTVTHQGLAAAMKNLEDVNVSLMEANDAVYRQQEAYNNVMRLQRDQIGLERSIFPTFFTHPEQLQKLADEAAGKTTKSSEKPRSAVAKTAPRSSTRPRKGWMGR